MLHFRLFFLVFFLFFGITSYVIFPLIAEEPNWWPAVFFLSAIAALSCLNAFIGTFFGMNTTNTGKICMQTRHLFYRWADGIFTILFDGAAFFAPRYMKNKQWSGVVTGCSLFWLLMPLVILELIVTSIAAMVVSFFYLLFTGNLNLEPAHFMPGVYLIAFFSPMIASALTSKKFPRLSRSLGICFVVVICSLALYTLIDAILENGALTVLIGFGKIVFSLGAVVATIAATFWIASYIYHVVPALRNTVFGQLVANAKKGICPVAVPCPVNEESK